MRRAAVTIRRLAGRLTYHPATGRRPHATPELVDALAAIETVIRELQQGAEARARDEDALATAGDVRVNQIHLGHAAVDQGAQTVLAAIGVLGTVLYPSEGASIDAPYGHGAPRRHHPGAMCTIVAERVESLAQALDTIAILKANLDRGARSAAAPLRD
ncbi:MAG: hypothetical protein ACT4P5_15880 [Armatimonadota bacterium]